MSPTFCEIFSQSYEAEQDGSLYICGIGYGKALEFLIKYYAKTLHPNKEVDIEKCSLAKCIQNYVDNERIKKSSDLARWLRNDETHYVKKYRFFRRISG
ncbi:MAG: DUF4145 domain-containing protein [Desulfuromonadales bacterium]|nr:MAG: DUF4145 domain-containing protein [Desulfuromonadales bacterium]